MRDSNRKEMKGKGQGRDKETITELKGKRWYTNEYRRNWKVEQQVR